MTPANPTSDEYLGKDRDELRQLLVDRDEEIDRLKEIIREHGKHAETCEFHGECRCELREFQL